MTDILEEILNDNKEEKRLFYFKKLLPIVIIFVLITVIIMIINNWYNEKKIKNNQEIGDILVKAIRSPVNEELTIKPLEHLVATSNNKTKELAAIAQIGFGIKRNDWAQTDNLLNNIINNQYYDELTTAYARLIWISLNIDKIHLSDINITMLEEYLNYFDTANKPFYGTANLLKAHWYIKKGSKDLAINTLTNLISLNELPLSIKKQANYLLATLTIIK